jgi:hypothetical protein
MAPFILAFPKFQCMLDEEVVGIYYDEWNKSGSTIKRDIE